MDISKNDWKLFQNKIGKWQESYMEKLLKEYVEYLNSPLPASTKFWETEKRIKNDKRTPGVLLSLRKQNTVYDIVSLIDDGVITFDDLDEFSDRLKEDVRRVME